MNSKWLDYETIHIYTHPQKIYGGRDMTKDQWIPYKIDASDIINNLC